MNKIYTISYYTFKEIIKSKILYLTLILSLVIFLFSYVGGALTYGAPGKVALDIGLGLSSLSMVGMSIFLGVALVKDELDQRTVYTILSRPVKRYEYILGKYLGLSFVILLNHLVLYLISISIYYFHNSDLPNLLYSTFIFIFIESLIVLAFVIFFSIISNKVITILSSLIFYTGGYLARDLDQIFTVKNSVFLEKISSMLYLILPDLNLLNLKKHMLYGEVIANNQIWMSFIGAISYIALQLLITITVFQHKSLD